ncbi:D-alanyl-D-alanine carboxypeptidase family protein [Corynebacterium sp.]|uniref:D-alanyl-D-alanine carboxypeptidase family protein n=1 Tax=Corynebacterium sp. TaxID=1720 RepID=UPI0026DD90D0|nr:serine hydrolase [Corynebacterium sp.]MDO5031176.1 serine hydrolase [Corynebacterium sp.]
MRNVAATASIALLLLSAAPYAAAQEDAPGNEASTSSSPIRTEAPDTDDCPFAELPEPAITTSERLAPGQAAPTPLPPVATANCGVSAPEDFRVDKDVVASAWMVSDIDTGEIIAMKDPNGRYRPASIIKALLALVAIDELPLDKKVHTTMEDASVEGSAVGIGPDTDYTVEQLLQGLLMASGNDAAHALAQALGGDEVALRKVNALAKKLGTQSTYAASYSGLDAPGMSTSAEDISLIYQAAFHNPTFARLVNTEHVEFPGWGEMPGYQLWNDNRLYLEDPDGIGGKTGYTEDAHHTFVGALDRGGRRLQAVILNTTVEHGPRAWQQAQMLLHEAYEVPEGHGVGMLADAAAPPTTTVPPTPTPAPAPSSTVAAEASPEAPSRLGNIEGWVGWVIAALVGVALIAGAGASLLRR